MKFKIICLLLLSTTACTFQVDIIETPTAQPSERTFSPPATAASTLSLDLSATPSPLPTLSPTSTTAPASVSKPGGSIYPVQFAPNGTYVDILDSVPAGQSKTYSVNAMKGQVMSISFHQNEESEWTYLTLTIIGADRSVLCDTCAFWRGVLPASQDYFVTVTPSADALNFMMRVAIDPPGAATQSFVYENKYRNASLSYTDRFAPAFFPSAVATRIAPELALQFIDSEFYSGTNLIEAYFLFGSSTDPQIVADCTQPAPDGPGETVVGGVNVHGVSFTKSESIGAAAGNVYEQTYYRAAENGTCFEIVYFLHSGNIGNYNAGSVTEFDHAALLQKFDEILSTFTLQ